MPPILTVTPDLSHLDADDHAAHDLNGLIRRNSLEQHRDGFGLIEVAAWLVLIGLTVGIWVFDFYLLGLIGKMN